MYRVIKNVFLLLCINVLDKVLICFMETETNYENIYIPINVTVVTANFFFMAILDYHIGVFFNV